jgi:hypothetical protein
MGVTGISDWNKIANHSRDEEQQDCASRRTNSIDNPQVALKPPGDFLWTAGATPAKKGRPGIGVSGLLRVFHVVQFTLN